jgi:hypothetical protein
VVKSFHAKSNFNIDYLLKLLSRQNFSAVAVDNAPLWCREKGKTISFQIDQSVNCILILLVKIVKGLKLLCNNANAQICVVFYWHDNVKVGRAFSLVTAILKMCDVEFVGRNGP